MDWNKHGKEMGENLMGYAWAFFGPRTRFAHNKL
jgi:hypothetical protein